MAALEARSLLTRETILSPDARYPAGVGGIIGMVGGLRSERWTPSRQNNGRHQIGIGGRLTSESAAPFETGEICACGPAVFAGYYDNPEANAKAFRDGWFCTCDLGHMDAEGFVFITGRASDMYVSGGSNVYPREIEEKVLQHPDVAEVAVLGMPDPVWGEAGVAVCVLRDGAALTATDLLAWLAPQVTRYKLPKHVAFWDALPRSAYGKVTKTLVRAELEARPAPEGRQKNV